MPETTLGGVRVGRWALSYFLHANDLILNAVVAATVNITSDLTAETGQIALNQTNEVGAGNYTITIQSSGPVRTISGTTVPASGAPRTNVSNAGAESLSNRANSRGERFCRRSPSR